MTTGTYTPATLNDPLTVTYTATEKGGIQIRVELWSLASGDTLTVKRSDDHAGTMSLYDDDTYTGAQATSGIGYNVTLDVGTTVTLVLNQTAGTLRTFNYSIWVGVYG